jgi:hypothetical protein
MFRLAGRPLFYLILALVVFLLWKAPLAMSALLADLGHIFGAIGNGLAQFFGSFTGKH